jgi:hypothetical protein
VGGRIDPEGADPELIRSPGSLDGSFNRKSDPVGHRPNFWEDIPAVQRHPLAARHHIVVVAWLELEEGRANGVSMACHWQSGLSKDFLFPFGLRNQKLNGSSGNPDSLDWASRA